MFERDSGHIIGPPNQGISPTTKQQPQQPMNMGMALDQQYKGVEAIWQTIQELEARLSPILSVADHPGNTVGAGASPTPSAFLGRILMHNQGIESACFSLRMLINRLEL